VEAMRQVGEAAQDAAYDAVEGDPLPG